MRHLLWIGMLALACRGRETPQTGDVAGVVTLSDAGPAEGVELTLAGDSTFSDADGAYAFQALPVGDSVLHALLDGYQPLDTAVAVLAGQTVTVDLTLEALDANGDPEIASLSVVPAEMVRGGTAAAVVSASDPDGDELTLAWAATGGFTVVADDDDPASAVITAPGEPDASGLVSVTVADGFGGEAETSVLVTTAANRPPTVSGLVAQPAQPLPGQDVTLTVTAADPDGDPLGYTWTAPGGWTLSGAGATVTLRAPTQGGSGIASVVVDDGLGGEATSDLFVSTALADAPQIASVTATPPAVGKGGTMRLSVTASDPHGQALAYAWEVDDQTWIVVDPTARTTDVVAPNVPGDLATVSVTVSNAFASSTAERVVSTTDNGRPVLGALTAVPPTTTPRGAVQVRALADDPDGDALTYTWVAPTGWTATPNGAVLDLVAPNAYGAQGTVDLTVSDGFGGTARGQVLVSTVRNNAPVLTAVSASPAVAPRGGTVALSGTASDVDGGPLSWAWTAPSGWTLTGASTRTPSMTAPNAPSRSGSVDVTVTDDAGATATGSVLVATVANARPTIASLAAAPSILIPGGTGTVSVVATDADDDPLTYVWTATGGFTVAGTSASATVTGPVTENATGTVSVVVSDGYGGSQSASIPVQTGANRAPVLQSLSASPSQVAPGATLGLDATASDADGGVLTYTWDVPAGWTLTGTGAHVTLTAPATYGAAEVVGLTVSDPAGATATGRVGVSTLPNLGPFVSTVIANPGVVAKNGTIALTAYAGDPNGDPLTYTWSAPGGWTLTPGAGNTATLVAPDAWGQTGLVEVEVRDPVGATATGAVLVQTSLDTNLPPGAPTVGVSPATPTTNDALTCAVVTPSIDPEGGTVTYTYAWLQNGTQTAFTGTVLPASATAPGDGWTCVVTPNDGTLNGAPGTAQRHIAYKLTFQYTGGAVSLPVPTWATRVEAKLWGAAGGGGNSEGYSHIGGPGGYAAGTIPTPGGETLTVKVGQGGSYSDAGGYVAFPNGGSSSVRSGYYTGGGGGRSAIERAGTDLLVAAGGGGAGATGWGSSASLAGGGGGGLVGEDGSWSGHEPGSCTGKGGTQSTGGAGGTGSCAGSAGKAGGFHFGANGGTFLGPSGNNENSGGGGGDGRYGGGSGAVHAGGGGGSSYADPSIVNPVLTTATASSTPPNTGDGDYEGTAGQSRTANTGHPGLVVVWIY